MASDSDSQHSESASVEEDSSNSESDDESEQEEDVDENEEDPEPVPEVTQHVVQGRSLTMYTTFEKHYEQDRTFILCHRLKDRDTVVASASSFVIHKGAMRGRWHSEMDIESDETQTFSTTLFDNGGRLRRDLIDHTQKKGTGVWGSELDDGSLLYIVYVGVSESERDKGLAQWMLQHVLHDKHAFPCSFAYAWPMPSTREDNISNEDFRALTDRADRLFAKVGFRRVGRTSFLGYAMKNGNHPSRALEAKDDVPQLRRPEPSYGLSSENISIGPASLEPSSTNLAQVNAFPLNGAIANEKDDAALLVRIEKLLQDNPDNIRKADEAGITPLHMAAQLHRPVIVARLLKSATASDVSAQTWDGQTPLDCVEAAIASDREFKGTFGMSWLGSTEAAARSKCLLLQAMGIIPSSAQQTPNLELYRYGCTCGQCIGGYFSPAMQFRLRCSMDFYIDHGRDELDSLGPETRGRPVGLFLMNDHFPKRVRSIASKTFLLGIQAILSAFSFCLDKKIPPTVAILHASITTGQGNIEFFEQQAYATTFYSQGGRISNVLGSLLFTSHEEGPLGDNTFSEVFGEDIAKLPECANDLDWTLLRHKLGVSEDDFYGYEMEPEEFAASLGGGATVGPGGTVILPENLARAAALSSASANANERPNTGTEPTPITVSESKPADPPIATATATADPPTDTVHTARKRTLSGTDPSTSFTSSVGASEPKRTKLADPQAVGGGSMDSSHNANKRSMDEIDPASVPASGPKRAK